MATGSGFASESPSSATSEGMDRLKTLYPAVNEDETPLPHSWSSKDKYSYIGLSQNNLRVHYKGSVYLCEPLALHGTLIGYNLCTRMYYWNYGFFKKSIFI